MAEPRIAVNRNGASWYIYPAQVVGEWRNSRRVRLRTLWEQSRGSANLPSPTTCAGRAWLRTMWGNPWEFDSPSQHQNKNPALLQQGGFYFYFSILGNNLIIVYCGQRALTNS